MDWLQALAADKRLQTLLALIVVDLAFGILAAVRTGTFRWAEVARFYRTTVLPVFAGYGVLRLVLPFIAVELLGAEGAWLGDGVLLLLWTAGVAAMLASIGKSLAAMGITLGRKT